MFNFFTQKPEGHIVTFSIEGMHCTSCAMNIDGELEDTEGVLRAETKYGQSKTVVIFNPLITSTMKLKSIIESLGYSVKD